MPIIDLELLVLIPDRNGEPQETDVTFRNVLEFPSDPRRTIVIFIGFFLRAILTGTLSRVWCLCDLTGVGLTK
jgi:hypothetical protein